MKRFMTRIILCVVPTILSILIVAWAYNEFVNGRGGFRLGTDLAGGTILVYEVDETKLPENFKAEDLAAALKRRIDPADLYNITIRPVPGNPPRVEIVLPTGGRHQAEAERRNWKQLLTDAARQFPVKGEDDPYGEVGIRRKELLIDTIVEKSGAELANAAAWVNSRTGGPTTARRTLTGEEVENIKSLIARQGRLEFKILANTKDDAPAIEAARKWFDDAKNQATLPTLEVRAEPPPSPRREDGGTELTATTHAGPDQHAYRWVEMGKTELYSLGLNTEALAANERLREQIEKFRKEGKPFIPRDLPLSATELGRLSGVQNCLVFSREISAGGWARREAKDREQGKRVEYFILVREPNTATEMLGDDLVGAREDSDQGKRVIAFTFSPAGGDRFWELTSRNRPEGQGEGAFKRNLAIIFDGQVVSAPNLIQPIRTRGHITGEFTTQEINDMVRILRAGALPATLKKDPVSQNSMGATLGDDTIRKGTWAILWSFVAVLAFMVIYYRFAGLVACVALLANLVMTVAFMVLVQAAFTLPGLAGLVLMLGMAVDANVLIYERLREERDRGASLAQAIRNGYEKAFPTILDTHLASIFTAIVLYVVGNDQLKGFGISLTVGLIISLFTSLYMTRTLFEIWLHKGWLKELGFYQGLVNLVHSRYWDFMSVRHYWFAATAIITVLGGALFIWRAETNAGQPRASEQTAWYQNKATVLNIDFTGGTAFTGRLKEPMSLTQLRERLNQKPLPDQSVEQLFVGTDTKYNENREAVSEFFTLRTSVRDTGVVLNHILGLLRDDLKQVHMNFARVNDREYRLTFADAPGKEGKPDFASQAQLQTMLGEQFASRNLPRAAFSVDRPTDPTKEEQERYSELTLRLNETVPAGTMDSILTAVQQVLADSPQPERLENFDRQLANNTVERALYAIVASWIAILLYLWFRFGNWTFGAAAVVCLIHDLFFALGAIAAAHYIHGTFLGNMLGVQDFKIDLTAVAALLTLVGYSVNDTIVVFDRIREVRGKNPALTTQMINDSVNQTLTRTILASLTTLLVVLVLYIWGGEGVKLFAFVMIVGIFVGTYSSIYIAPPLLLLFGEGQTGVPQVDRPAERPAPPSGPSTAIKTS